MVDKALSGFVLKLIPGSEELNEKFDSTPLVSVSVTVYRVPSYLSS